MHAVGATPPKMLPELSPTHVRVALMVVPSMLGPLPAEVQEYVATLPTLWPSLYAIAMPLAAGSSAQGACRTSTDWASLELVLALIERIGHQEGG